MLTLKEVSDDLRSTRQMLYWYDRLAVPLSLLPHSGLRVFLSPLPDSVHNVLAEGESFYLHRIPLAALNEGLVYRFNESVDGLAPYGIGLPGLPWNRIHLNRIGLDERVTAEFLKRGVGAVADPYGFPTVTLMLELDSVRCLDPVLVTML